MAGLLLSATIATARGILNDTTATYRYSDADLLQYANDALDVAVGLKPSLFYTEGELACTTNASRQKLSFDTARALVEVTRVKAGNVVYLGDRATMDAILPGWQIATAAAAENWFPVLDDPLRVDIYPPSPANQILVVLYVKVPSEHASGTDTGLPTTISDAIADYIVYRAESRDDEHVLSARVAQFLQSFEAKIKA